MNIRDALVGCAPSLTLLRAAQDEIARLDSLLHQKDQQIAQLLAQKEQAAAAQAENEKA